MPHAGTEYLMFTGFQLGRLGLTIFTVQLVAMGKDRNLATDKAGCVILS